MLSPRSAAQAGLAAAVLLFGTCLALLANGAIRDRNLLRHHGAAEESRAVKHAPPKPVADVPQAVVSRQAADPSRTNMLHHASPME
jgi:hypothetical protein